MAKYVAFLRAINVGGHTVKMDHLRGLFESLGFTEVATVIASGNVIFTSTSRSPALEKKIEDDLRQSLGYQVITFVRATSELKAIAACRPLDASEIDAAGNAFYIGFLKGSPSDEAKQKLASLATDDDKFHFSGHELYWLRRKKFSDSKLSGPLLEKTLGMRTTLRNSTTVKRIASLCS
ncbi:MAG TPA: DUF1697 domain-containing protein [Blastocatellia bacterium]|nr:DUF1697 domain-containing protein [Blastocatellia bacterium]